MNRPFWLSLIYALAALSFAAFCLVASWTLWSVRATIEENGAALKATIGNADKLLTTATKTAEETRLAASRFNDPERVARFDDYIVKQAASALANTQNTRRIGANLNAAIKEDLRPLLQDLRPRLNATIDTLNSQIAANGDRVQALLDEGKILVADSRIQVVDLLKELNSTAHGLSVITNDPDLVKMIDNLNMTSGNLAGTAGHIEVISGDLEGLSTKYLKPLYQPKESGFFGKLGNGALTVFRYATGASNIIYLIGRF